MSGGVIGAKLRREVTITIVAYLLHITSIFRTLDVVRICKTQIIKLYT